MEGTIGEIRMFGGNFAPRAWAFCDGQLLPIAQNTALFSILGTTFGGDGRTTFGLPGMRGRVAMHPGNGPGLSPRRLGEKGGVENVTLNISQIPSHTHTSTLAIPVKDGPPDTGVASGHVPANTSQDRYSTATPDESNPLTGTIANNGGGQSHTNVQPFLCVNYIICLQGTFPSRS